MSVHTYLCMYLKETFSVRRKCKYLGLDETETKRFEVRRHVANVCKSVSYNFEHG